MNKKMNGEKVMKKMISVILCVCLLLVFNACGSTEQKPDGETVENNGEAAENQGTAGGDETSEEVELQKFKIGWTYYSSSDPFAEISNQYFQMACDAIGSEYVYIDWVGFDTDGIVASYQSLIEKGCDAVVVNLLFPGIIEVCEKSNVAFLVAGDIDDENLRQMAFNSPMFIGMISGSDYEKQGIMQAKGLIDTGCTKIAYIGPPEGTASIHDIMYESENDYIESVEGVELVVADRSGSSDALMQVLTSYPEVDGFILATGEQIPVLYNEGLTDRVKVATLDADNETVEMALKDNVLVCYAGNESNGGQSAAFVTIIYNYLSGHDLIEDKTQTVVGSPIFVYSYEEYQEYKEVLQGEGGYMTAEEVLSLIVDYNPDATYEDLLKIINVSSPSELIERRAN